MAKDTTKRCSTSLLIRKMQIKTTGRYHYRATRVPKIRVTTPGVIEDTEQRKLSCIAVGSADVAQTLRKIVWHILVKPKRCLFWNPIIRSQVYIPPSTSIKNKQTEKTKLKKRKEGCNSSVVERMLGMHEGVLGSISSTSTEKKHVQRSCLQIPSIGDWRSRWWCVHRGALCTRQ